MTTPPQDKDKRDEIDITIGSNMYALCDDGTIWIREDDRWTHLPHLSKIPQIKTA